MFDKKFLGVGTVGERGQIAIPTDARKGCAVEAGQKMVFFSVGEDSGFLVLKAEKLSAMIEKMESHSKVLKELLKK